MDKFNWFYRQIVQESDLDDAFDNVEESIRHVMSDQGYVGVVDGLDVVPHSPTPNLTVDIAAGVAYDQLGRRIAVPSLQVLDVSADSNSSSTAVAVGGNEKWISVFVQFEIDESDLRNDGNGDPVYYVQTESYQFIVTQGAEALIGTATRPALRNDAILIADIRRTNGDTSIPASRIESSDVVADPNSRFQYVFNISGTPASVRTGSIVDAMQAMMDELNDHVNGVANAHPATGISYAGSPNWADASAVTSTNVEAAIDEIVSDLASVAGANKIGAGVASTWRTGVAPTGANVDALLESIVTDLADQTGATADGASRIGAEAVGNLAQGSVRSQLNELDAEKGGLAIANAWTNGNTFAGASTFNGQLTAAGTTFVTGAFNTLNGGTFNAASYGWNYDDSQVAHGGAGNTTLFTLRTPSASGEAGMIEILLNGTHDNDPANRRAAHIVVSYGRPNAGSTDIYAFVNTQQDVGAGIDVTYQIVVVSNAIIVRGIATGASTNNYQIAWRRIASNANQ